MAYRIRTLIILLLAAQVFLTIVSSDDQTTALLKFKESLNNATQLNNWDESVELCKWKGLICSKGDLTMLQLEGLGLYGTIDVDSLVKLPNLRQFSVANNGFSGGMPDVKKLGGSFRALYLSNNKFSGDIPDDAFVGLNGLRRVILANNEFTGTIPTSLTNLPKLVDLQLQNNQFHGKIPDFPQVNLTANFVNNKFEGPTPPHLQNQNPSLFAGNELCGPPLKNPCKPSKKVPKIAIILSIVAGVTLLVILVVSFILCRRKPSEYEKSTIPNLKKKETLDRLESTEDKYKKITNNSEPGILNFVRNGRERFELEDLLRASAEVLGSGSFGSSYKAELLGGGPCMVVKRFRQMNNVGKNEFFEHMKMIGRLSHPNLLPLVAFYYGKEEKLLVSDFVPRGSLASLLHGKQSPNQPGLDWPTRLRIIKGVAKGLDYLYKELPNLVIPHGHLKSSNVLLDNKFEPILSDYALAPLIKKDHAKQFMVAYKSPESTIQPDNRINITRKTDVWSLGILVLELLTGRFPENYLKNGGKLGGGNGDLAAWVNSVVREEWTGEVFDKDMKGTKNREGQMLKLLKIGMCCCEINVEKRWDFKMAFEKIVELKEKDISDEDYSNTNSYGSEDMYSSSRAMTDDDFSFSVVEKV